VHDLNDKELRRQYASAKPPKPDLTCCIAEDACFVPISVVSICSNVPAQKPYLLNQLIGTGQQRGWDGETDGFGRLDVDDELKFHGLLYG
jgi:hypothetical protein